MDNDNEIRDEIAEPFRALDAIGNTAVAPAHAIAGIALSMAMKYHDMAIIKDGQMYQQYKLEGRNIREIHLNDVFETAMKIEAHLLGSSARIAKMVVDAIAFEVEEDEGKGDDAPTSPEAA